MAYIAMARKWRPNSFQDMVGQEHIAKTLQNAIEGGRLHHAFLFTGTRGVGKTTSARILARTLNCMGSNPLSPCGVCASCKDISGGNPMDVLEIDAASNTGVDNIRELLERVQYAPMIGKYKVFIIDEVHMLSNGAFNALLKTLEEPPSHVIFIFATTEVNKVPQTILSRVQRFDFKRLTTNQIIDRLKYICDQEKITTDVEALGIFAEKADGSMRDALTYFDQAYAFTGNDLTANSVRSILGIPPNELYFKLIHAFAVHDIKECFEMVDKACSIGVEFSPLLDGFGKFLRNLLYSRLDSVTAEELNITPELFGQLKKTASELSNGDLLRLSKILTELQSKLHHTSNPRLLVETTFARMAWLDHMTDLRRALAAINDYPDASNEALKKKVTEVTTSLDSVQNSPSTASWESSSTPQYSRYEISSAWNTICRQLSDDHDLLFTAALSGTSLLTPDLKATPFPVTIQFKTEDKNENNWSYKQFLTNTEFQERLVRILEDYLQTTVELKVAQRLLSESEIQIEAKKKRTPYEKDLEDEKIFTILNQLFDTELVFSRKIPKNFSKTECDSNYCD